MSPCALIFLRSCLALRSTHERPYAASSFESGKIKLRCTFLNKRNGANNIILERGGVMPQIAISEYGALSNRSLLTDTAGVWYGLKATFVSSGCCGYQSPRCTSSPPPRHATPRHSEKRFTEIGPSSAFETSYRLSNSTEEAVALVLPEDKGCVHLCSPMQPNLSGNT